MRSEPYHSRVVLITDRSVDGVTARDVAVNDDDDEVVHAQLVEERSTRYSSRIPGQMCQHGSVFAPGARHASPRSSLTMIEPITGSKSRSEFVLCSRLKASVSAATVSLRPVCSSAFHSAPGLIVWWSRNTLWPSASRSIASPDARARSDRLYETKARCPVANAIFTHPLNESGNARSTSLHLIVRKPAVRESAHEPDRPGGRAPAAHAHAVRQQSDDHTKCDTYIADGPAKKLTLVPTISPTRRPKRHV